MAVPVPTIDKLFSLGASVGAPGVNTFNYQGKNQGAYHAQGGAQAPAPQQEQAQGDNASGAALGGLLAMSPEDKKLSSSLAPAVKEGVATTGLGAMNPTAQLPSAASMGFGAAQSTAGMGASSGLGGILAGLF
jgi:hypothetical protein